MQRAWAPFLAALVVAPHNTNNNLDDFVCDLQSNTTQRSSVSDLGAQGSSWNFSPQVTDGGLVVFQSSSEFLSPGDTNMKEDVFLRELNANTTRRISVGPADVLGNESVSMPMEWWEMATRRCRKSPKTAPYPEPRRLTSATKRARLKESSEGKQMSQISRVRVFMACSLDGFIAGPDNNLEWLHDNHSAVGDLPADPQALHFEDFIKQVGVMLMGRTTYDVVSEMGIWPYGSTPVWVATRRDLVPLTPTVQAVQGDITTLIQMAQAQAGEKDVYLDGGDLIHQALNAGLVDEITATLVPVLLTRGTRLFDGLLAPTKLQFCAHHTYGQGMVQWTARLRPAP